MEEALMSKCIVCGELYNTTSSVATALDGRPVMVTHCEQCGLATPHWAEMVDPIESHGHWAMEQCDWGTDAQSLAGMVRTLKPWLPEGGLVGEVGAGRGALACALIASGYQYAGCEPGMICTEARRYFNLPPEQLRQETYRVWFDHLRRESVMLGACFIWHVLEHVAHPEDLIHLALAQIKPRGHLLIQVPRMAQRYLFPEHLHFFTARTMQRMAGALGVLADVRPDEHFEFDAFILERLA